MEANLFEFRIINLPDGNQVVDPALKAPYEALTAVLLSDGELRETQTANYFSNLYPIDCAVPSVNA